uniref:Hyaluronidase n=1 Tax=Takifugu rubripes TaxID=31033 RepID=A0A3B5K7E2_TAKRU
MDLRCNSCIFCFSSTVMKVTQILFCILFSFITPISTIETRPPAEPLLIHDHPFVAIWSAPTSNCRKHEILLDLAAFSAVTTPALEPDQFLITYYEPRLGLYPRIHSQTGMSFEGGIPQNGSLEEHLKKVKNQIPETLTKDSSGLVVIDWESWRPLWDRNWGSKKIYRDRSIDHARKINQSLAQQDLIKLAKRQFEEAGRKFMVKTISLGIIERPCRLWGFYLFPDCYNYGWEEPGYTGRCSEKTKWQNDQLLWLWEKSKALFPSVYISQSLGNSTFAKLYVRNRVQEAMRVAELPHRPHTVPVYVYSRPLFRDQSSTFLSQMDLVSTVGEIAAVGASGVVMWGSSTDYDSKVNRSVRIGAICSVTTNLDQYSSWCPAKVLHTAITNPPDTVQLCGDVAGTGVVEVFWFLCDHTTITDPPSSQSISNCRNP